MREGKYYQQLVLSSLEQHYLCSTHLL